MPWSNNEKIAVQMARRALGWNDPQYHLVLQQVAGVRKWLGKISSTNPNNTQAGFVRFMAFCERSGYVDAKKGQGFWSLEAERQCPGLHWKINDIASRAVAAGLFAENFLGGFIERQTQKRPVEQGGPTRHLNECDAEQSFKILEGLKIWAMRESRERGIVFQV